MVLQKLTQALQISKKQYGVDLTKKGELFITKGIEKQKIFIIKSWNQKRYRKTLEF